MWAEKSSSPSSWSGDTSAVTRTIQPDAKLAASHIPTPAPRVEARHSLTIPWTYNQAENARQISTTGCQLQAGSLTIPDMRR